MCQKIHWKLDSVWLKLRDKKQEKITIFPLIIIFQQFQVVELMDMMMLFHLIYYLINLNNFKFLGFALTSELTVMGELLGIVFSVEKTSWTNSHLFCYNNGKVSWFMKNNPLKRQKKSA